MLRTWYKPSKSYKISGNYFNLKKINYKQLLNIPCLGFFSFLTIKSFFGSKGLISSGKNKKKYNTQCQLSKGSQCRFYPVWHIYCFLSHDRGSGWRGPGLFHQGTYALQNQPSWCCDSLLCFKEAVWLRNNFLTKIKCLVSVKCHFIAHHKDRDRKERFTLFELVISLLWLQWLLQVVTALLQPSAPTGLVTCSVLQPTIVCIRLL